MAIARFIVGRTEFLDVAIVYALLNVMRTLAVLKGERSMGAPDIPTTAEAGVPDVIAYTYNIILAPDGTPKNVVDTLSGAIRKVMNDRAFTDTLVKLGVDPISDSGPDKAAAMIRTELDKWSPLIQALGLSSQAPTRSASPRR